MLSGEGESRAPITVERLDAGRRADFFALHGHPPFDWCFCVAWNVESWEGWGERSAAENRALREEMLARGRCDGYLLYVGDEVAGWCQCGPRDDWPKLRLEFDLPPRPDTWAVTCFCVRPEYRRRGLAHALLAGVLADLRRREVARVEAFPRPGRHQDDEVWTGPENLFLRAGFRPVMAGRRRSVMSLELSSRAANPIEVTMSPESTVLRRSRDKMIAGVCAGIAERLGWPANRVRIAYGVLSILSAAFPGILVYVVLWIAMPGPEEP